MLFQSFQHAVLGACSGEVVAKISGVSIVMVIFAAFFASVLARQLLGDGMGDLALAGTPPVVSGGAAPARDGNIAIREEFDMAVEQATAEAYDLFIQRHPNHPLTVEARRKLDILINLNADR